MEKENPEEQVNMQAEECAAENQNETLNEETQTENNDNEDNRLAELEEKCADLADKNLRMMAEFDNYRRRTNKEKLEMRQAATEDILKDMLPLIDDFERAQTAMQKTDDINAVRDGIELIFNKFMTYLAKYDVKPIDTENADFNVDLHEAVTLFDAGEDKHGKVLDCMQKGYTMGEKVIRFAKVVVGK